MIASAARIPPDGPYREDHFTHLRGATWADYERILALRGDKSGPRICYNEGDLEIMSPSRNHEAIKSIAGCLVEAFCLERDIPFCVYGSWTLKDEARRKGVEPDECYVFGEVRASTVPDLAIEVIWTSGGMDKLDIYRFLGVREVWIWQRDQLQPHVLRGGDYVPAATSQVLPGIDLAELAACSDEPTTSAAIKRFRAHCRTED